MVKINLNKIIYDSVVDGPGVRTVIFLQGCNHKCPGCHNVESWSTRENKMYNIDDLVNEVKEKGSTSKITISGGEPFLQPVQLLKLVNKLKESGFSLYIYSGFTFEELIKNDINKKILIQCEFLVDGKFYEDKLDLSPAIYGSSNQKVINLKNMSEILLDI